MFANIIRHGFIMHTSYYTCITTYHNINVGGSEYLKKKYWETRKHTIRTNGFGVI